MQPPLILPAFAALALLSACGDASNNPSGPERRSAAGEVLGGEVSDAMLPLDTTRSTSPPGISSVAADDTAKQSDSRKPAVAPTLESTSTPEPAPKSSPSADPSVDQTP